MVGRWGSSQRPRGKLLHGGHSSTCCTGGVLCPKLAEHLALSPLGPGAGTVPSLGTPGRVLERLPTWSSAGLGCHQPPWNPLPHLPLPVQCRTVPTWHSGYRNRPPRSWPNSQLQPGLAAECGSAPRAETWEGPCAGDSVQAVTACKSSPRPADGPAGEAPGTVARARPPAPGTGSAFVWKRGVSSVCKQRPSVFLEPSHSPHANATVLPS